MNTRHLVCALFAGALLSHQAAVIGQEQKLLPPIFNSTFTGGKEQPNQPEKDKDKDKKQPEKKLTDPPDTDFFTRTPAPIRDALGYNPHMMGDWFGVYSRTSVNVVGVQTITQTVTVFPVQTPFPLPPVTTTTTTSTQVATQRTFVVPVPHHGAFKVAENASPRPIDRIFFTYNFYSDIRSPNGENAPTTTTQTTTVQQPLRTTVTTVTTVLPGAANADLHRETFGFEKTFLDGRASVELRVPMIQQRSSLDAFRADHIGDLTVVGKYAFILDPLTGDVLSAGLAVTAPTGPSIETIAGPVRSTLLQPWFGYIYNLDRLYLHAFHSAVLPTDQRDVTLLFNDVGVGYWLFRGDGDRPLRFVVPTFEAHVTTPLSNRGANESIFAPDQVVLTGGVHIGVFRGAMLSFGVGTPVTGPRTFEVEGFGQLNFRF